MDPQNRALFARYQPRIWHDRKEPFPILRMGCSLFREPGQSASFPGLQLDPQAEGADMLLEYAVYYDYDIQHLYDLEHVWVAIDASGAVTGCWSSFHGMRLRVSGVPGLFRLDGTHPVLYAEPGKHALLPDPSLIYLHDQFPAVCNVHSGGGLLIPPMLDGLLHTTPEQDSAIRRYIRARFAFQPSMEFRPEAVAEERLVDWPELLEEIPRLVERQLAVIRGAEA